MKNQSDFGVVVGCCKFDFFLAKACCASVRHFLGNVPLTLLIDDELDAGEFSRTYDVKLFYRKQVKDLFLRSVNRGWGMPKMSLFWESPYERFLWLDCDTIVWGDVVKAFVGSMDWDLTIDAGDSASRPWINSVGTPEWVNKEYFNTAKLEAAVPSFPWRQYIDAYFCTGAMFARRGALDLEEYKATIQLRDSTPKLFPPGEMGMLNYLLFRMFNEGRLKLERKPMELICDFNNYTWLGKNYPVDQSGPVVAPGSEKILHFTDPKPLMSSWAFHEPMDYFRKEAASRLWGVSGQSAEIMLRAEETPWRLTQWYRRKHGGMHRYVKPLMFWRKRN